MNPELPEAVRQEDLREAGGTPGILRRIAFQTDNNVLVQAHVEGGVSSGWHHHGDRHVYAHLLEGAAIIEYGPAGDRRLEIEAGGFFHLPPRIVHRDVNPLKVRAPEGTSKGGSNVVSQSRGTGRRCREPRVLGPRAWGGPPLQRGLFGPTAT